MCDAELLGCAVFVSVLFLPLPSSCSFSACFSLRFAMNCSVLLSRFFLLLALPLAWVICATSAQRVELWGHRLKQAR